MIHNKILCSIALFLSLFLNNTFAQDVLDDIPTFVKSVIPAPNIQANSWLVVNYNTGWIIAGKNIDTKIEPASLTKLMTSYLVFEAIDQKKSSLQDKVYISKKAWKTGGSKMFVQVGTYVPMEALIQGLVVQSGNDAAVALAEHLAGSEEGFSQLMNRTAKKLGMDNTYFTNSNGLPDKDHYTTVKDLAILSMALIKQFPEQYKYYSQHEYTYSNITQQNRNSLLYADPTSDGIKTGYTKSAGYCLIGSANRKGIRYIAAVMGADSKQARTQATQSLLEYAYSNYDGITAYRPGDVVKALPLYMGDQPFVDLGVQRPLSVIFPRGEKDKLSAALNLPDSLDAPLKKGSIAGDIQIKFAGNPLFSRALQVNKNYIEGPVWSQFIDTLKKFIL